MRRSPFVHHLNLLAFASASLSAEFSVATVNSVTQLLSAWLVNKQASLRLSGLACLADSQAVNSERASEMGTTLIE